jgi:hypothetical protein
VLVCQYTVTLSVYSQSDVPANCNQELSQSLCTLPGGPCLESQKGVELRITHLGALPELVFATIISNSGGDAP